MTEHVSRRTFVKGVAGMAGAIAIGGCAGGAMQSVSSAGSRESSGESVWNDRMGLELFTVRDEISKDFEGTLAQVAAAGYREVEPTTYGSLTPKQVRAVFDRLGLTAPSTHVNLVPGPDLERQLAGFQEMGHRYASVGGPRPPQGAPGAPRPTGLTGPRGPAAPQTVDGVKRQAEMHNEVGAAGRPYGVKVLIHNHTGEFQPFTDGSPIPYDVLFANTDPAVVVFQLDIGWARVAGQDILGLFAQHPHRFPLWHVKDMADLAATSRLANQGERQRAAKIVPVGLGEIDYRPIFARAADAGLEHYCIEQDTAPETGSLAAMRLSAQNLRRVLG